jgi:hypothetical protein
MHDNKITNFNFNYLNIETKKIECEEYVRIVENQHKDQKQNNILKINLNSSSNSCSSSSRNKKQEKTKKKLFCNIIAQNNLTNKVNKFKNER